MDVTEVIALNARVLRAARDERQQDVADRGGLARTTLSMIESGERGITLAHLIGLCRGLETNLSRLLDGADPEIRRLLG